MDKPDDQMIKQMCDHLGELERANRRIDEDNLRLLRRQRYYTQEQLDQADLLVSKDDLIQRHERRIEELEQQLAAVERERDTLFNTVAEMGPQLRLADALLKAVDEYTTEREYQNVAACRKDQDRLEQVLLDEAQAYRAARGEG